MSSKRVLLVAHSILMPVLILSMAMIMLSARPAEAAPFAYVINYSFFSIIDTATNTMVSTIPISDYATDVAITPNGRYAYVTHYYSGTVSVIDTATNTVVDSLVPMAGYTANAVAISPNGSRAYVANYLNDGTGTGIVSVIDTATNTVVSTISVGNYPHAVAFTPDGKFAYVIEGTKCCIWGISVIDTAADAVVTARPLDRLPLGIAFTSDGKFAYVPTHNPYSVLVIDTNTNEVKSTILSPIPDEGFGEGIAITSDGKFAYVANIGTPPLVSVIDTATNTVVGSPISVAGNPRDVAITPDGKFAYVTTYSPDTVSVISTTTKSMVSTIPLPSISGEPRIAIALPPAKVQQPINADGSSVFSNKRGVIPVKFTLSQNRVQTSCNLPEATISMRKLATDGTSTSVNESSYMQEADSGINFRIDAVSCQYIYNLAVRTLDMGAYSVDIRINDRAVGSAIFALR